MPDAAEAARLRRPGRTTGDEPSEHAPLAPNDARPALPAPAVALLRAALAADPVGSLLGPRGPLLAAVVTIVYAVG